METWAKVNLLVFRSVTGDLKKTQTKGNKNKWACIKGLIRVLEEREVCWE